MQSFSFLSQRDISTIQQEPLRQLLYPVFALASNPWSNLLSDSYVSMSIEMKMPAIILSVSRSKLWWCIRFDWNVYKCFSQQLTNKNEAVVCIQQATSKKRASILVSKSAPRDKMKVLPLLYIVGHKVTASFRMVADRALGWPPHHRKFPVPRWRHGWRNESPFRVTQ